MNNSVKLTTKVFQGGRIEHEESRVDALTGAVMRQEQHILETREKATREALISLGWTPPPSEKINIGYYAKLNGKEIQGNATFDLDEWELKPDSAKEQAMKAALLSAIDFDYWVEGDP